ncbi:MAG: 4-(cytidine 5'-diphospho)-2-C-methyl-D-erythritol kinase, partial [Desulfurivibrionaceae bacterium]
LRTDGYHELQTVMQKLELSDRITLRPSDSLTLSCPDSALPEGQDNLAYKAAQLFGEKTSGVPRVKIVIEKNIPVAAGLGGGSSDAGLVLKGLNSMFGSPFGNGELEEMGGLLGADVPFFVSDCKAALATGIGDCLDVAQSVSGYWCLLVNPGYEVSTKEVYNRFNQLTADKLALTRDNNFYKYVEFKNNLKLNCFNELESVTLARYPELSELKESLMNYGALVSLLAGSGPTVFGLFADREKAVICRDELADFYPVVILTRTQ